MLPGLIVWGSFALAVLLSFFAPLVAVVCIITFDLYWLFRVLYFIVYLLASWRRYRYTERVDWRKEVEKIPGWESLWHMVFLPIYGEDVSIVRRTLKAIRETDWPKDRMVIVLAGEGREEARIRGVFHQLEKEFGGVFRKLFFTIHPTGLPDEIPGKGSNLNWSGHRAQEMLEKEFPDVAPEHILVSALDVDTLVPPVYFSYLAHRFLTTPDGLHSSYQPLTLFTNNIWHATAPVRVAAFGTTFWLLTELSRPDRLWTFSSHSMPWKMLLDVGFWQKDIVSEDSRIFLQGLIRYHGNYRVTPLYIGVSMDTVTGATYLESLRNLYRQQRRWAWGVEHLMEMVEAFRRDPLFPRWRKLRYLFFHMEGMYTWATAPVLIFLMGWLPLLLARQDPTLLVQAAPGTLALIMRFATLGVILTAILSMIVLPSRPRTVGWWGWVVMLLQWILLPVTFMIFGAFPAIDAQTRLMCGRYLGFQVTKKQRL